MLHLCTLNPFKDINDKSAKNVKSANNAACIFFAYSLGLSHFISNGNIYT